jgi:hypothetical protein
MEQLLELEARPVGSIVFVRSRKYGATTAANASTKP